MSRRYSKTHGHGSVHSYVYREQSEHSSAWPANSCADPTPIPALACGLKFLPHPFWNVSRRWGSQQGGASLPGCHSTTCQNSDIIIISRQPLPTRPTAILDDAAGCFFVAFACTSHSRQLSGLISCPASSSSSSTSHLGGYDTV